MGVAACAALLVAGCGGGDSGGSDELASLVPPNVPAYVEMVARPHGEQRDAIESIASRVGGIDDPGSALVQQLDAQLAESGTTYEDDIEPWLGEREALFFQSFNGDSVPFAAILETTDPGAAQDFLEKLTASVPDGYLKRPTYNGVQYLEVRGEGASVGMGVVNDFLVVGPLDAFKAAVDASNGSSLAESGDFEDGVSAVSSDNIGLGYVDSSQAIQAATATMNPLEAQALKPLLATLGSGPVAFSVSATSDEASVDVSLPTTSAQELTGGDLVGKAPADAWFALGAEGLGQALDSALDSAPVIPGIGSVEDQIKQETGVDPRDVVTWMQDGYAFVSGTSEKTIAIGGVARSSDQQASSAAITLLEARFRADVDAKVGPPPQGAEKGFSASAPESPQGIQVGQFGDHVVGALGPGQPAANALHPKTTLADDPSFQAGERALGSDFSPLAFMSLGPFFLVAEKGGQANDPDYLAAKPYLQKLDYLILGTSDGDRTTARFVVGVK
jgi:Protein of unknown function (DUF3352)